MFDEEQRKIFSENLIYYIKLNHKTQKEVADALEVSPQTFNTWYQGNALPRMERLQRLADYFGISKSALIDKKTEQDLSMEEEAHVIAQELLEKPELFSLYQITRELSSEHLKAYVEFFRHFKKNE